MKNELLAWISYDGQNGLLIEDPKIIAFIQSLADKLSPIASELTLYPEGVILFSSKSGTLIIDRFPDDLKRKISSLLT